MHAAVVDRKPKPKSQKGLMRLNGEVKEGEEITIPHFSSRPSSKKAVARVIDARNTCINLVLELEDPDKDFDLKASRQLIIGKEAIMVAGERNFHVTLVA